jgi:hypothetical protein
MKPVISGFVRRQAARSAASLALAAAIFGVLAFTTRPAAEAETRAATMPAAAGETAAPAADDTPVNAVKGHVTKVIAYRGQALVTREVEVGAGTGMMDVVVTDLPDDTYGDSLFADGDDGVDVRAVRYRTRVVNSTVREDLKKLVDELEITDKALRQNQSLKTIAQRQSQFVDKLEAFTTATAMTDMSRGALNADALTKLTTDTFTRRDTLGKALLDLDENARTLEKTRQYQISLIQEKGGQNSRLVREAVVFLDKRQTAAGKIRLNYIVGSVNWRPVYSIRAASGKNDISVEYSALVTQTSGEDWKDVSLTLSTASPALIAQGADLAPLQVSLRALPSSRGGDGAPSADKAMADAGEYTKKRKELRDAATETARNSGSNSAFGLGGGGGNAPGRPGAAAPADEEKSDDAARYRAAQSWSNDALNSIAEELQKLEFGASEDAIRGGMVRTDGVSVEYELPGSIGLASRADQQLVRIARHTLNGSFFHIATPVLSDFVYLHSEAVNNTSTVFLEGTYTAYLDGRFVGKSAMPMVAQGDSFAVGFGVDSQLRVSRELISKKSEFNGGNRETTFNYRLSVQNFKDREVNVRLMDRLPKPKDNEIRVSLKDTSEKLSEDRLYVRDQKPAGILRWDLKVGKGTTGADAKEVKYTFTVEHDRKMEITGGK